MISTDIDSTTVLLESAMTGLCLSLEDPGSEQSNDLVHLSMTAIEKAIRDLHEINVKCLEMKKEREAHQ